jgi:hypothetical protein
MRVKFAKGGQRKFIDLVIEKVNSPSLRGLLQFGLNVPYSTLKNYYVEERLLSEELFLDLCGLARLDKDSFDVTLLEENWGKVKGGMKSKRK